MVSEISLAWVARPGRDAVHPAALADGDVEDLVIEQLGWRRIEEHARAGCGDDPGILGCGLGREAHV
jgi:hypothetical protein